MNFLCKMAAAVIYRVVQEYRDLEDPVEDVSLGLMDDGTLGPGDPAYDVYCNRIGFSAEQGKLRKED